MDIFNIVILSLSGLLLFTIGTLRISNPIKNYSKNSGIKLENEVNVLSEARGVSSVMLFGGIIMLLGTIVPKLTKRLGKVKVDKLLSLLNQNNLAEFSRILLVDYYDPLYSHSMRDVKYDFSIKSVREAINLLLDSVLKPVIFKFDNKTIP